MIPEPLPWHDPQWQRIERSIQSARVPHALLLRGGSGNGKAMFAARLAAVLLCRSSAPPCGTCESCRLFVAGSHPDWSEVTLETDRREIVVDQIRGLIHTVGLTARFGRYKVVVVDPAELMNRHAANTLLKTLEEPPGRQYSSSFRRITRSSCRRFGAGARGSTFPFRTPASPLIGCAARYRIRVPRSRWLMVPRYTPSRWRVAV